MSGIRNDLSEFIRRTDGGNRMEPLRLGLEIALYLSEAGYVAARDGTLPAFVEAANPNKTMGAGALADAVVDHFDLDVEEAA